MLCAQQVNAQPSAAQIVSSKLSAELQKQKTAYREARQIVRESAEYKLARKERDNAAISKLLNSVKRPDYAGIGRRALVSAEQLEGDAKVELLGWAAVESRDADIIREVLAEIRSRHMDSPALSTLLEKASVLQRPLGKDDANAFLDRVIADSPHNMPRAWALYWRSIAMTRRDADAEQVARGQEMMMQAEKLAEGSWLADKIAGPRFKKERLQIGMTAPDIEGEDIDGVAFKLSDYRGKVVVLDFWGFW
jgi:hypothetical protein